MSRHYPDGPPLPVPTRVTVQGLEFPALTSIEARLDRIERVALALIDAMKELGVVFDEGDE